MENLELEKRLARLSKPVRITDQSWPEDVKPVVSVFCIAYNHAAYVREAIEGFLMQETTFPVEIYIHDDASSDGTDAVINEYAEKFPRLIRTVVQSRNQYSQTRYRFLFEHLGKLRGEFVAFCEGDDYWIDRRKLQKQIDLLRSHPESTLCFSNALGRHEGESRKDWLFCQYLPEGAYIFSLEDFLLRNWFTASPTMVFKANVKQLEQLQAFAFGADLVMQLSAAAQGSLVYLDELTAVYRRHSESASHCLVRSDVELYERFRLNYVWTLWVLADCVALSESALRARNGRVKETLKEVARYLLRREPIARFPTPASLEKLLLEILEGNRPQQAPEAHIQPGALLPQLAAQAVAEELRTFYRTRTRALAESGNTKELTAMAIGVGRNRALTVAECAKTFGLAFAILVNVWRVRLFRK